MSRKTDNSVRANGPAHEPHRVRLPGFLIDKDVGLGDVVKRATSYIGIKPCGGCRRRADALNRWLTFTRRPPR